MRPIPGGVAPFVAVAALALTALASGQQPTALPADGTVEGRVLGPLGEPMVGVEVRVTRTQEPAVNVTTRTDGDGMFVLGRLPRRSCRVSATAPGFTATEESAYLAGERPRVAVRLRLWSAITLRGRVVGPDGAPVPGIAVIGSKDGVGRGVSFVPPEATTDADGRFELSGVPIGECVVRAWLPGCGLAERETDAVADQEVEVRLDRGGSRIRVQVEGLPQERLAAVSLRVLAYRRGAVSLPGPLADSRCDAAGVCELVGLPDATWVVVPMGEGITFDPKSHQSRPGQDVSGTFTARMLRSVPVHLGGVLHTAAGAPLARRSIRCTSTRGSDAGTVTTDAEGRFLLVAALVVGETCSLRLEDPDWLLSNEARSTRNAPEPDGRIQIAAMPTRELELVAAPAARVSVRLVDGAGRPVPLTWANLQVAAGNGWRTAMLTSSARDGTLTFRGVNDARADFRIEVTDGGWFGVSRPFRCSPDAMREIVVAVHAGGRVDGRLLDGDGHPRAGVSILLDQSSCALTDRDGRFALLDVPVGEHRLGIWPAAAAQPEWVEQLTVAAGQTVRIDLKHD